MRFLLILFVSLELYASPMHVLIDPGHGGIDTGAVRDKAKESEITLKVSLHLKEFLKHDPVFQASLTRTSDQFLTLPERVALAEKTKADLFISIHANASTDQRARGVEIYFQNHLPPDEETLFLAATENKLSEKKSLESVSLSEEEPTKKNDILSIIEDLKRQHRMVTSHQLSRKLITEWDTNGSIRQAPFFVVSKTNIPSVLVELGFLTNPKEADKLMNPAYQKEIARKIYKGLIAFRQAKENLPSLGMIPKNQ